MSILEAREVSKIYPMGNTNVTALDKVSLAVDEGQFVAIQGTSGSGKSTLLNMLGGLDHPTTGQVFFGSKPLGPLTKEGDGSLPALFGRHDFPGVQFDPDDDGPGKCRTGPGLRRPAW